MLSGTKRRAKNMTSLNTMLLENHEALIAKINNVVSAHSTALVAVVKLHTYVTTGKKNRGKSGLRPRCTECGFAYPCPTLGTIAEEIV